jgi:hypothetical protein
MDEPIPTLTSMLAEIPDSRAGRGGWGPRTPPC